MLDDKSIEIINQFKQSLLTKSLPVSANASVLESNRGKKLDGLLEINNKLDSKVVEYDGISYLVSSSKGIDRSNKNNKRKWHDYFENDEEFQEQRKLLRQSEGYDEEEEDHDDHEDSNESVDGYGERNTEYDEDSEEDSEDENPLKDLRLTEILLSLRHPSEVVSHPGILGTFKLPVLSKLASELINIIEDEQNNLNWMNKLLQVLNGEDWYYLLEDKLGLPKYDHGLVNDRNGDEISDDSNGDIKEESLKSKPNANVNDANNNDNEQENEELPKRITRSTNEAESDQVDDPFFMVPEMLIKYEQHQAKLIEAAEPGEEDEFKTVQVELINYLQVSIQSQQEYIKNLMELRNNIVRAQRLKEDLYKWGKEMHDKKSS